MRSIELFAPRQITADTLHTYVIVLRYVRNNIYMRCTQTHDTVETQTGLSVALGGASQRCKHKRDEVKVIESALVAKIEL